jgi:hypothetical protein
MTAIIIKIKRLFVDAEFNREIQKAKQYRQKSEEKIQKMIADLNGCSDKWFLLPKQTLDECVKPDKEKDNDI